MQPFQTSVSFKLKRKVKYAVLSMLDVVDAAYLRVCKRTLTPPYSLRSHVAPLPQFFSTTDEYIAYFKLLGGLGMADSVLDVGCGVGRFAARLVQRPHYFHGTYDGFDPSLRCIRWASKHISRPYPNVKVRHVNLYNSYYNPFGDVDPRSFRFPYEEDSFDFVFAWSVFTHIMPDVARHYLTEIARVLRPGKRALITCLLLDGYPASLSKDIIKTRQLTDVSPIPWDHRGEHSILHPDRPEKVVAYQRSYVTKAIRAANLTIEAVHNGCWNHLNNYMSEQDIIVVSKPVE